MRDIHHQTVSHQPEMDVKKSLDAVENYIKNLQTQLCDQLEAADGSATFYVDAWKNPKTGVGSTRVLENGQVFEKAAVNFSRVSGSQLPRAATSQHVIENVKHFEAMGISVVIHPLNPYVPTIHANLRLFLVERENQAPIWWFGGGYDLTPYYGFEEDARHWHQVAKAACDPFGADIYAKYKKACDDYFYLPHRKEPRGIGGLFFDNLNQWGFDRTFEFIRSVGDSLWQSYGPIVEKRKNAEFGERERNFQCYRRGRYVEFNLVYDRGTLFGLQFGGRTESILVSLPPQVTWLYNWTPEPGTPEARLYDEFLIKRDWLESCSSSDKS